MENLILEEQNLSNSNLSTKVGVVTAASFSISNYNTSVITEGDFQDVVKDGVAYKKLWAASEYIDGFPFDLVFNTMAEYQAWLDESYKYCIVYDASQVIEYFQPDGVDLGNLASQGLSAILETKSKAITALTALGVDCSMLQ